MNSWKKLLFGKAIGVGANTGTRPRAEASKPGVRGLIASFLRCTGGIIERRGRSRERRAKRGK